MANPSHDYSSDFREIFRRLEALETYPRVPTITDGGIVVASSGTPLAVTTGITYTEVAGGETVEFTAGEQGKALVMVFVNHTLEVSAGQPTAYVTPGIVGVTPTEIYAISISSSVSPFTETGAVVAYFEDLLPGPQTACFYAKNSVTGTVLSYTLNTQAIVAFPL